MEKDDGHQRAANPSELSAIRAFRAIGDKLGTAGQPTEQQFRAIHDAGFTSVINLALPSSDYALPNEGSIVSGLGMTYIHIPVEFAAPRSEDFRAFCGVMHAFADRPVFVHCAVNKRVSAFVFLYRVLYLHVPVAEAERDLKAVWEPDVAWRTFIEERLGKPEHRTK